MREKIPSEIHSITLGTPVFKANIPPIRLAMINFFYGKNGTGKTTISRAVSESSHCLSWAPGVSPDAYDRLVFNEDFIGTNIRQHTRMPGVFLMSREDIAVQDDIDQHKQRLSEHTEAIRQISCELKTENETAQSDRKHFEDQVWAITKTVRERFIQTGKILEGYTRNKAKFVDKVLGISTPAATDLDALEWECRPAFDSNAQKYHELPLASIAAEIPGEHLLGKQIISSGDSSYSQFLKALNAMDWVRDGHERFHVKASGHCPYCGGVLPEDFEEQLSNCFDAQYQADFAALQQFADDYSSEMANRIAVFRTNLVNGLSSLEDNGFRDKLEALRALIALNEKRISEKLQNPSSIITLEDCDSPSVELNGLIEAYNHQIRRNNEIVDSQGPRQVKCSETLWKHFAYMVAPEVETYHNAVAAHDEKISALQRRINAHQTEIADANTIIRQLTQQTCNSRSAMERINNMLRSSGFCRFKLEENPEIANTYRVIRPNGMPAEKLSEGERNFIAFLYFCQLVFGGNSSDTVSRDKIVVIDDPVSSMDSSSLFVVASLVRDMIDICRNNANMNDDPVVRGNHIKQILLLTHNPFFHNEIANSYVKYYDQVSLFRLAKDEHISDITPCIRSKPGSIDGEFENYTPVQDAYATLWSEVKETASPTILLNVMGQILSHYFIRWSGLSRSEFERSVLLKLRDQSPEEFETASPKRNLVETLLRHVDAGSSYFSDGFYYDNESIDCDMCRTAFEEIFRIMGQCPHYEMMMGK